MGITVWHITKDPIEIKINAIGKAVLSKGFNVYSFVWTQIMVMVVINANDEKIINKINRGSYKNQVRLSKSIHKAIKDKMYGEVKNKL